MIYFGTKDRMRWVKAPAVNTPLSRSGWSAASTDLNGGGHVAMSPTAHKEYQFSWGASPAQDVHDILDYRSCAYGDGLVYFADPFAMRTNAVSEVFSAPALLKQAALITGDATSAPSGGKLLATNLATNPSFESTSGTVEVYRNLATNPSFESTSGPVEIRRNYHKSPTASNPQPNGVVSTATAYSSAETVGTYNVSAGWQEFKPTVIPVGGRFGTRSTFDFSSTIPSGKTLQFSTNISAGAPAGLQWCLYVDVTHVGGGVQTVSERGTSSKIYNSTVTLTKDASGISFYVWLEPTGGAWSGTYTGRASWNMIEVSEVYQPAFSGSSQIVPDSDLTSSWTGTPNESESIVTGERIGILFASSGVLVRSKKWAKHGQYSGRLIATGGGNAYASVTFGSVWNARVIRYQDQVLDYRTGAPAQYRGTLYGTSGGSPASNQAPNVIGETELISPTNSGGNLVLYGGQEVGQSVYFDMALVTEQIYDGPYFDGSTSPDPDLTPSWTGAVNNSPSVLTGTLTSKTYQNLVLAIASERWKRSGTKSMRLISRSTTGNGWAVVATQWTAFNAQILPGKTYTVLATRYLEETLPLFTGSSTILLTQTGASTLYSPPFPNVVGETEMRWTFSTAAEATALNICLTTGRINQNVWYDDLMLVEGNYTGPYFDGNSRQSGYTFNWLGAENASASEKRVDINSPLYTSTGQPLPTRVKNATSPVHHVPCPPNYKVWVTYTALGPVLKVNGVAQAPEAPDATTRAWKSYDSAVDLQWSATTETTVWGLQVQVLPYGTSPDPYAKWVVGRGNSGLRFSSEPTVSGLSAVYGDAGGLVSATADFKETGLWE